MAETAPPTPDVLALLHEGAATVARWQAEVDRLRAELSTHVELLRRYSVATAELRWSITDADVQLAGSALEALWAVLDDARGLL